MNGPFELVPIVFSGGREGQQVGGFDRKANHIFDAPDPRCVGLAVQVQAVAGGVVVAQSAVLNDETFANPERVAVFTNVVRHGDVVGAEQAVTAVPRPEAPFQVHVVDEVVGAHGPKVANGVQAYEGTRSDQKSRLNQGRFLVCFGLLLFEQALEQSKRHLLPIAGVNQPGAYRSHSVGCEGLCTAPNLQHARYKIILYGAVLVEQQGQ